LIAVCAHPRAAYAARVPQQREEDGPVDDNSCASNVPAEAVSLGPDTEVEDLVSHEDPVTIYTDMQFLGGGYEHVCLASGLPLLSLSACKQSGTKSIDECANGEVLPTVLRGQYTVPSTHEPERWWLSNKW